MIEALDRREGLTRNQYKILGAAMLADLLEFFDLFLIGFVLAFIVEPWGLTFGQTALILVASGVGGILGPLVYGRLADRLGRRPIFMSTVLTFSVGSLALAFTPEGAWWYLVAFRFVVGFGAGGLYVVDLPLVQEYMPASRRGLMSGLVVATGPLGLMLGSLSAGFLAPVIGWRGLFVVGAIPALLSLLVRAWVPESPRWLLNQGRLEEARRSLAWALEVDPEELRLPAAGEYAEHRAPWTELLRYPRSLIVSVGSNFGIQTAGYGYVLWTPTLLALLLGIPPERAALLFLLPTLAGFVGRLFFSAISDRIGRRVSGVVLGVGSAAGFVAAGLSGDLVLAGVSVFFLFVIVIDFFIDGGYAIVAPYGAEVWPGRLRTTGLGTAYGVGGFGKIIGPMGLALIAGTSDIVSPEATRAALLPAFIYLACFAVLAAAIYAIFGFETKGRTIEDIDRNLEESSQHRGEQLAGVGSRSSESGEKR